MKRKNLPKRCFVVLLGTLMFASCFNNVDLSNISKSDISLMDHFTIPIGGTTLRVDSLLKSFDVDELDKEADIITIKFNITEDVSFSAIDLQVDTIAPYVSKYSFYNGLPVDQLAIGLGVAPADIQSLLDQNLPIILPIPTALSFSFEFPDTLDLGLNPSGFAEEQRIDSILVNEFITEIGLDLYELGLNGTIKITLEFDERDVRLSGSGGGAVNKFPLTIDATQPASSDNLSVTDAMFYIPTEGKGVPFRVIVDVDVNASSTLTIGADAKIQLSYAPKELDYEVVYGLFTLEDAGETMSFDAEIEIPSEFTENSWLAFYDPELTLTVNNYIGAGFTFGIDSLKAYDSNTSKGVHAHFSEDADSLSAKFKLSARPLKYGDASESQSFTFNKDEGKGEINRFFMTKNFNPNRFSCRFSASKTEVDRDGQGNIIPNFVTQDLKMGINLEAKIPLQLGKGSYFSYTDTIHNVATSVDLGDNITMESVSLQLDIVNSLPLGATLKLVLLDLDGNIVESTLNERDVLKIYPAEVDGRGLVDEAKLKSQLCLIELTEKEYEDLKLTEKLLLTFKLDGVDESGNENMIALSSKDKMDINIALKLEKLVVKGEIFD